MEENISKALSFFGTAIFITAALSIFFTLYGKETETIRTVNGKLDDKVSVYQAENAELTENTVSGAYIIGCIENGLETDISVDWIHIPRTADINTVNFSIIDLYASYDTEYVFNSSGEVILIRYRKTGGER